MTTKARVIHHHSPPTFTQPRPAYTWATRINYLTITSTVGYGQEWRLRNVCECDGDHINVLDSSGNPIENGDINPETLLGAGKKEWKESHHITSPKGTV